MGGEDSSRVIIGRQKPTMAGGREGGDAAVAVAPRLAGVGRGGESSPGEGPGFGQWVFEISSVG